MRGVILKHRNSKTSGGNISDYNKTDYIKEFPSSIDVFGIQDTCLFYKDLVTRKPENKEEEEYILRYVASFPRNNEFQNLRKEFIVYADLTKTRHIEALRSYKKDGLAPTCDKIARSNKSCLKCPHYIEDDILSPFEIVDDPFVQMISQGFRAVNLKKNPVLNRELVNYYKEQTDYIALSDASGIYLYNGAYWERGNNMDIDVFCEENVNNPEPKNAEVQEFKAKVLRNNVEDRSFFDNKTGFINVGNGIFDVEKNRLLPHDKSYGFTYKTNFDYNGEATCPMFRKFLSQVFISNKEVISVTLEFMGAALAGVPNKVLETSMMFYGDGSNGKSTFVNVLKQVFGAASVSDKTMTALAKPEQRVALEGKILNIGDETAKNSMLFSDTFKQLTSGSKIDVKRLYHQPYDIESNAKLIFLCNDLPKTTDKSYAFLRRLLIIPFQATFKDELGNIDRHIESKLIKELPGIFNLVVKHYKILKKNKFVFSNCEASDSLKKDYEFDNDSMKLWFDDNCDLLKNGSHEYEDVSYKKNVLYDNYNMFCQSMGIPPLNNANFFKQMRKQLEENFKEVHKRDDNGRYRVIHGLKLLSLHKYKLERLHQTSPRRW